MTEESSGIDRFWAEALDLYREEWEMLVDRARQSGYGGALLRPYVAGLVDALDSDRAVGILEAVAGYVPDDWRAALQERLLRELHATGGLIVWCVVRVSPSGKLRELRNIHGSEESAHRYVEEHPLPAQRGTLEVEDWLVVEGEEADSHAVQAESADWLGNFLASLPIEHGLDADAWRRRVIDSFPCVWPSLGVAQEALRQVERQYLLRRLDAGLREWSEVRESISSCGGP